MYQSAVGKSFLKSMGLKVADRTWHGIPRGRRGSKNNRRARERLLEKDPFCYYCGLKLTLDTSTLDHTIPKSKGGTDIYTVLACYTCNQEKGDKIIVPWNILRELGE